MSSFHSLLPHLQTERGHYFAYHRCIQEIVHQMGLDYEALVSSQCNIDLPSGWKRYFPKRTGRAARYWNVFLRFGAYCKAFLRSTTKKQFFFLECFSDLELTLLTAALLFFSQKTDHLLLLYRYSRERYVLQGKWIRFLTKLLHKRLGSRFTLLTDSELLLEDWKPLLNLPMTLVPIPHTSIHAQTAKQEKKRLTCWWPGEPRLGKGLNEIGSLLSALDEASKNIELVVAASAPLPQVGNALHIHRVPDILPRDAYDRWFVDSDIILLPYDAKLYRTGTSGIFVEAVIAGKLPIAKEGNWIAHELKKHDLSELILDWNAPKPLSQIVRLFHDPSVKKKLSVLQQAYASFHSLPSFAKVMKTILL